MAENRISDWLHFYPIYFLALGVMLSEGLTALKNYWQWQIAFSVILLIVYWFLYKHYMRKIREIKG